MHAGQGASISLFNTKAVGAGPPSDVLVAQTGGTISAFQGDISGGRHGVIAYPGGSVELDHSSVHDNADAGLFAFGGAISAHGGGVTNTANIGVSTYPGGYVDLADGILVANNGSGVSVDGGRVLIQGHTAVEDNTREGVVVQKDGSLQVEDGVIQHNGGFGVAIVDNSVAGFGPNDVVDGNGGPEQIFCNPPPANPLIVGPPLPAGATTNCSHA